MLYLVKRVFRDGKCIGYYVSDGNKTVPVKLEQVIQYALAGRIKDVAVRNVKGQQILYGLNGFSIEKLDVEKTTSKSNKQSDKLRIMEVYENNAGVVGYTLELNGKQAKVNLMQYKNYLQQERLDVSTLSSAKRIRLGTNYSKEFDASGLKGLAGKCVEILKDLGDNTEVSEIVAIVNKAAAASSDWKGSREEFNKYISRLREYLEVKLERLSGRYIQNKINLAYTILGNCVSEASKIMSNRRQKYLVKLKRISNNLKMLATYEDINEFNGQYNSMKVELKGVRDSIVNELKEQDKIRSDMQKIRDASSKLIATLDKRDELYNEKVMILREPWCYKNVGFLESGNYLENCYITEKGNPNKRISSLANVRVKALYNSKKQPSGFEVVYKEKQYRYNRKMTNLNMIAAYIKAMEDANKLNGNDFYISVKSNGKIKNIKFIVKE